MGTDIHVCVQRLEDAAWKTIAKSPGALTNRNYDMFAILADVRNGHGFAGVPTGEGFQIIAEPRGIPDDFADDREGSEEDGWASWLGDHTFSWLTLREILEFNYDRTTKHMGVLTIGEFLKLERSREDYNPAWDSHLPQPDSWCSDVSGGGIVKMAATEARAKIAALREQVYGGARSWDQDNKIVEDWPGSVYITDAWEQTYLHSAQHFLAGLVRYIKYGLDDVRLVFGFDS